MLENNIDLSSITESYLEGQRLLADPLADELIEKIIREGDLKLLNEFFLKLVNNQELKTKHLEGFPPNIIEDIEHYFIQSKVLPDWANTGLIELGENVFAKYGPEIFMLLNVSSLPMCYTCAHGAQVLFDTGRLMSHHQNVDALSRRLMETGQMIFNVLSPGGLSANGRGLITIQKVRLIHASIRYYLLKKDFKNGFKWDTAKLGVPINQEDLAGTLMSFGPVILNGLIKLDIQLTEKERKAYIHVWQVVGHLMGLNNDLNPSNYEDGFGLASRILSHQAAPSQAGKALTSSCIEFLNHQAPGNVFDNVPAYMIHYFLEDFSKSSKLDLPAILGIQEHESLIAKLSLRFSQILGKEVSNLERNVFIRHLSERFNKALLQGVINHFNDNKSVHFYIPPSLKQNWDLNSTK